jgi:hypothetical protein
MSGRDNLIVRRRVRARENESDAGRVVEVGWLLCEEKGGFIYDAPRRVTRNDQPPKHAKSASYCPSVVDHEARLFEIPAPFDVEIGLKRDDKGQLVLANLAGDMSAIRSKHLGQISALVSPKEWRHPERPLVQIMTPYTFLADEPVFMTQLPPFMHYREPQLPGILVGGRLPIHVWPRTMMWAFEWFDVKQPIRLRRGEPWFYVRFETMDPARPVRLIEAERTPDLDSYLLGMTGVTNYVRRTYSLFATAKDRRPERLLTVKRRKAP